MIRLLVFYQVFNEGSNKSVYPFFCISFVLFFLFLLLAIKPYTLGIVFNVFLSLKIFFLHLCFFLKKKKKNKSIRNKDNIKHSLILNKTK